MDILMQFVAFVVTVLVLISFHEAGHFVVAKLLGIKVLKFSIGFGKALARFHDKQGTEYVLALIPLGGYVKLLDEREQIVPEAEKPLAFNRQPLWARTLVVLAGPLINLLFAVVCLWLIFMIGVNSYRPIIGSVTLNSIAAKAGLQANDEITKVDQQPTASLQKLAMAIIYRLGETTPMLIDTKNLTTQQQAHHRLDLSNWKVNPLTPDPITSLGIEPKRPFVPSIVAAVESDSPAAKAGLQPQDKILSIDGQPVKDWYQLLRYIQLHPGKYIKLTYQRQSKVFTTPLYIAPKFTLSLKPIGYLGIKPMPLKADKSLIVVRKYSPLSALGVSLNETWQLLVFNVVILKKMFLGQVSLSSLGGPIAIFQSADSAFKQGIIVFLGFLSLISIMLAFVNLLPIPGLDGGHLFNFLIEFLIQRPLSLKYEIMSVQIGLFILILIMILATFNDVLRALWSMNNG